MSLTYSRLGADLVLNAGLDWFGILYRHTLMGRVHAIEGGFSFIRAANDATSMGFDNRGRIRASMSSFEDNDHILLAAMPVKRTVTLYSRVGNLLAYSSILALVVFALIAGRNNLQARKSRSN
jgi:apolipoprotein N-acyltransferase